MAEDGVRAMVEGFRKGRNTFPTSVVFCEVDGARYAEIRDQLHALSPSVVELRPGPTAQQSDSRVVLNVAAQAPSEGKSGLVRTSILLPDCREAVVPAHQGTLDHKE